MPRFGSLDTQFLDDSGDPLVSGKIYFYEPGTTTLKNTYSDAALSTANSNPVELTAAGRFDHDVYYSGAIDAKLCTSSGTQIKSISKVGAGDGVVFDDYSSALNYSIGDIVTYNSTHYKSLANNNEGNTPSSSETKWEEIKFIGVWNTNISYLVDDVVQRSGNLYTCVSANSGGDPLSDDGSNWKDASPWTAGSVAFTADSTRYTSPEWLQCDGSAYNTTTYADLAAVLDQRYSQLVWSPAAIGAIITSAGVPKASWNNDDSHVAIGSFSTSPKIGIYSRSGDTFTKLADPATLPTGSVYACEYSPDGNYLAVAHTSSPYVTVYHRSGTTYTKLANPATLPAGGANSVSWDPTGAYLAVGHVNPPYVTIYEKTGTGASATLTKLSDPATLPNSDAYAVSYSPDGNYLAVGGSGANAPEWYSISGTTYTKLTTPSVPSSGAGNVIALEWDSTSTYLLYGRYHTSGNIYKRTDATTMTLLSDGGITSPSNITGLTFNSDGSLIHVSNVAAAGPPLFYTFISETLTQVERMSNDAKVDTVNTRCAVPSSDDTYLCCGISATPYVSMLKLGDILPDFSATDASALVKAYIKTGL